MIFDSHTQYQTECFIGTFNPIFVGKGIIMKSFSSNLANPFICQVYNKCILLPTKY